MTAEEKWSDYLVVAFRVLLLCLGKVFFQLFNSPFSDSNLNTACTQRIRKIWGKTMDGTRKPRLDVVFGKPHYSGVVWKVKSGNANDKGQRVHPTAIPVLRSVIYRLFITQPFFLCFHATLFSALQLHGRLSYPKSFEWVHHTWATKRRVFVIKTKAVDITVHIAREFISPRDP